jgi:type VI secretion system secreted protein VgrG
MAKHERFAFEFKGFPADTFSVISFKGTEGLSQLYEFHIELVSSRDDLDLEDTQGGLAVLTLRRDGEDAQIHGLATRFEQLYAINGHVFYRAALAPRLWRLTLTSHNQVFLDMSAPEFLAQALQDSGMLHANDFEFRLTRSYPKREYVCQFNESHYQFVARWMEREGMYYFFEQTEQGEKLVVADHAFAHPQGEDQPALRYVGPKGLDTKSRKELCSRFIREQNAIPGKVKVKDYNYRTPSLDIQAESAVDDSGQGEFYVYGDNCKNTDEAKRQAAIRAEEARLRKNRYKGRSTAAFLRAGASFHVRDHFRHDANAEYLPMTVKHEGNQTGYLMAGLGRSLADREARDFYVNTFTAIPVSVQYRPERNTPRPRFYGVMNAVVDAEGSGQYAELDEHGRYKIRLPFDLSGRPDGKASSWIRMAEPYAGAGHGMHFPLHKGTEVLLTFVDGDVDRPVIASAVPNFEQQNIVKDANAPANAIRSASGNQMVFGDKQGREFVGIYSPFNDSAIAVGAVKPGGGGSIAINSKGGFHEFIAGSKNSAVVGNSAECYVGNKTSIGAGTESTLKASFAFGASLMGKAEYTRGNRISIGSDSDQIFEDIAHTGIDGVTLAGGFDPTTSNVYRKAKKAVLTGVSGSIAQGAGVTTASLPWGSDALKNADHTNAAPYTVAGATVAAAGAGIAALGYNFTKDVVKSLNENREQHSAAVMKLDKNGAQIAVNADVHNSASFLAKVKNNEQESSIAIENSNYVEIDNNQKANMLFLDGNVVLNAQDVSISSGNRVNFRLKQFDVGGSIHYNQNTGKVDLA